MEIALYNYITLYMRKFLYFNFSLQFIYINVHFGTNNDLLKQILPSLVSTTTSLRRALACSSESV